MRIIDWISDVCSSDLLEQACPSCQSDRMSIETHTKRSSDRDVCTGFVYLHFILRSCEYSIAKHVSPFNQESCLIFINSGEIGSTSCRKRLCYNFYILVVAVLLKKTYH